MSRPHAIKSNHKGEVELCRNRVIKFALLGRFSHPALAFSTRTNPISQVDSFLRYLSVYGVLSQYQHIPDTAIRVISEHLDDSHGATRSLVLDYLEQNSYRDPRLHVLAPAIQRRFEARPEKTDFPLVADAELGPAAGPPMSETFRLARILVLMDAEAPSVTEF